jgi:hypothetical protein
MKGNEYCGIEYENDPVAATLGRCKIIKSDSAFLFLRFVACAGAAAVCYLAHKRGRSV